MRRGWQLKDEMLGCREIGMLASGENEYFPSSVPGSLFVAKLPVSSNLRPDVTLQWRLLLLQIGVMVNFWCLYTDIQVFFVIAVKALYLCCCMVKFETLVCTEAAWKRLHVTILGTILSFFSTFEV